VVHAGTGHTGVEGLRSILRDPALELVGHYAHSPSKIGADSGQLAGVKPIGIRATNDWKALLALRPDCLSYLANGAGREAEAVADIVPFLEAGVDVISTSLIPLCYPPAAPAALREPIAAACAKGGSSFFNGGLDPGFATVQLPVALLSLVSGVRSIRTQELGNLGDYPVEPIMREIFGFGKPLDWPRPMFAGGVPHWWNGEVLAIAAAMKIDLDEVTVVYEVCAHESDIQTSFGLVEAGTTAGVRFQVQGIFKGKPFIVAEHCSRTHADVAPHWPKPQGNLPTQYTVIIDGSPGVTCRLDPRDVRAACEWTANHPINAITEVYAAKPGIIGPFDLPRYTARSIAIEQ
jgi:hypothetical protein